MAFENNRIGLSLEDELRFIDLKPQGFKDLGINEPKNKVEQAFEKIVEYNTDNTKLYSHLDSYVNLDGEVVWDFHFLVKTPDNKYYHQYWNGEENHETLILYLFDEWEINNLMNFKSSLKYLEKIYEYENNKVKARKNVLKKLKRIPLYPKKVNTLRIENNEKMLNKMYDINKNSIILIEEENEDYDGYESFYENGDWDITPKSYIISKSMLIKKPDNSIVFQFWTDENTCYNKLELYLDYEYEVDSYSKLKRVLKHFEMEEFFYKF